MCGRAPISFVTGRFTRTPRNKSSIQKSLVSKRLREISQLPFFTGAIFLGKKSDIILQLHQFFKELLSFLISSGHEINIREPKTAGEKNALARGQAIDLILRVVTQNI